MSLCPRHEALRAAGIMAVVTANARGVSPRGSRPPAPGAGGRSEESWKGHIIRELKHRDLSQHAMFQDLIRFCTTTKYNFYPL